MPPRPAPHLTAYTREMADEAGSPFEWVDGREWAAPLAEWTLMRVVSGHTGWVRSVCVDVASNAWFATGSADQTVKVWDLATGRLKVTLTGHVAAVRSVCVSPRLPLLFSGSEDRMIKSWDLERNAVTRQYHGHLHGVYSVALVPSVDLLVSGSRDSTVKVWDVRTKQCIHTLTGHRDIVNAVVANDHLPHVVSGSQDSHVRLWDLRTGAALSTLTHHKKGVRAVCNFASPHARGGGEFCFASASADSVKKFAYPTGTFVLNYHQESNDNNAIRAESSSRTTNLVDIPVNALAVSCDGLLAGGLDDGSIHLWDWYGGARRQVLRNPPQPGSLDCENAISALCFDASGFRLLTAEVDKTVKVYRPISDVDCNKT